MDMAAHPARPDGQASAQRARWSLLAQAAAEHNAFYAPDMLGAALDHLDEGSVRLIEAEADGVPVSYTHLTLPTKRIV